MKTRIQEVLLASGLAGGSYKMSIIGEDKTGTFLNSEFPGFADKSYVFNR
jgi:hypothetical protein